MNEPQLIHVGTTESLAARIFEGNTAPDWFSEDENANGTMNVRQWSDQHIMIDLTLAALGDQHAVRVTVSGLYAIASEDFFERSEEDQNNFALQGMEELMPFLRQAVYAASSQVWPVKPIMIDARAGMTKTGARVDSANCSPSA